MTSPDNASGESALHVAVSMNHEAVVSQLLELGASLEVQDFAGKTVVMTACEYGHLQTLECLATRGINAAGTCTHIYSKSSGTHLCLSDSGIHFPAVEPTIYYL